MTSGSGFGIYGSAPMLYKNKKFSSGLYMACIWVYTNPKP